MRIISGRFGGRVLKAPGGRATRPTAGRTREAIFNMLEHATWSPGLEGARALDLFAGSGALGFEALSRGADFALFVETDAAARAVIRDNIEALGLFGVTRIHRRDACDLGVRPAGLGAPFNLVFADPPYGAGLLSRTLAGLRAGKWITPEAVLIVETAEDEALEAPAYQLVEERAYGAARIRVLIPRPAPGAPDAPADV